MLRMLTKTLIFTLCKPTMLTMLRLLVMFKITNVENVDKDVQSHLVQLYGQQGVDNVLTMLTMLTCSKSPMLRMLTKMFIPTLCNFTDSKVLTMLYMSKITQSC